MDLSSITGKALIDRKLFIRILAKLEPTPLDENSSSYHIGYENAKKEIMELLSEALGPEYRKTPSARLIQELRRDNSA